MIETFGVRLKRIREREKLSQVQVASLIGVSQAAVCSYESDKRQPPLATLVTMAAVFGVSVDYLLGVEKRRLLDVSKLTDKEVEMMNYLVQSLIVSHRVDQMGIGAAGKNGELEENV